MTCEEITLIGLDNRPGWETATARLGLPSHSWAYAEALRHQGLAPQLAHIRAAGAELLMGFCERTWQGSTDIVTLPGLSGARITGDANAPLALWRRHAQEQGWVCGYIQLAAGSPAPTLSPPDSLRADNALFIFDLARWDPAVSISRNTRKTLRAGDRAGAVLTCDTARLGAAFGDLHAQAMQRAGGAPLFAPDTLARWFAADAAVAFGAEIDGRIEAAHLGWIKGERAELHLAGSSPAGRSLQGWLIVQACAALRRRGVRFVNIGGYGRPDDGLHRMKLRFNIEAYPLRALCQIYRPGVFTELCRAAGADPGAAYFPPYRAPAA